MGYYGFCTSKSPTGELVSHDDNLEDEVLKSSGMSTQEFWDSRYGENDYIQKRAFYEPVGNRRYDEMVIYNKWPIWKIMMIAIFVMLVVVILICYFVIDLGIGWLILIGIGGISAIWFTFYAKFGDIAAQRQRDRRGIRNGSNRGNCAGACGAACGTVVVYGTYTGGDGGCAACGGGGGGGGCGGGGGGGGCGGGGGGGGCGGGGCGGCGG